MLKIRDTVSLKGFGGETADLCNFGDETKDQEN